jgi:hypothetical protein
MDYYNINSDAFFQQTYDVDMQSLYQSFLRYLPKDAYIRSGLWLRSGYFGI